MSWKTTKKKNLGSNGLETVSYMYYMLHLYIEYTHYDLLTALLRHNNIILDIPIQGLLLNQALHAGNSTERANKILIP